MACRVALPTCNPAKSSAQAFDRFYRAEVLKAVGGFPESFGSYFEDVDLLLAHSPGWLPLRL